MIEQVLEIIRSRDGFAITSHVRPDGDALGSELALLLTLEAVGKKAVIINRDPVPDRYRNLPAVDRVVVADRIVETPGAVFVLECDSVQRTGLEGLDNQFVVNIDHHHSTKEYGALNWIDENACAVGEMVYRIAKALGIKITPSIATNIYTAVVTDTGSFQFAATTAQTFRMAAELAECGADAAGIARNVFYSNPITKVNSMRVMLNRMKIEGGGRLVWTAITREDMIQNNCMEDDVEGFVNFPLTISGVEVAVFLRELEDGTFRVSLRSKNSLDVSEIAAEFGGGGHRNASGCTLAGPLEAARDLLLPRIIRGLGCISGRRRNSDIRISSSVPKYTKYSQVTEMSGVLVIDKPAGMTSHDVVNRVRLRFRKTKVGHLGTLDPMATGVLPLCLGKATRIGQFLEGSPKVYSGEMRLGFSTTTFDREGDPTSDERVFEGGLDDILAVLPRFTGEFEQAPPPFSAKKIGGVPSYKFARRGRPIATPAVTVRIDRFDLTRFEPPLLGFEVVCSPGTYIRSLADDLGAILGCGAHLTSLRRVQSGRFLETDAVTLEDAAAGDVIPLDRLLDTWLNIEISEEQETRIAHGNPVPGPEGLRQFARILNKRGEFLAVGVLENGWVRPRVVLTSKL